MARFATQISTVLSPGKKRNFVDKPEKLEYYIKYNVPVYFWMNEFVGPKCFYRDALSYDYWFCLGALAVLMELPFSIVYVPPSALRDPTVK